MKEIDNYAIQCYRDCPAYYHWRIQRGLVKPTDKRVAAEFGTAFHKALEAYYKLDMTQKGIDDGLVAFAEHFTPFEDDSDDKRTIVRGLEILDRYYVRYHKREPFSVIATEIGGAFELDANWTYRTRLDLVVEWDSPRGMYVIDHKSSSDIGRIVVKPHNQLTGYEFNVREMYENVIGTMLNVIGVYKTDKMKDKETGAMKEREIFLRVPTSRTPEELATWRREVLFTLHQIEESIEQGVWPKYTDFCQAFRGKCQYLDLCLASPEIVERMVEVGVYKLDPWRPYVAMEEVEE